jgi:hypothetical protein
VLSDVLQLIGTLLLVWLGVRYGVRPLRALSAQIAKRSAREGVPLDRTAVPAPSRSGSTRSSGVSTVLALRHPFQSWSGGHWKALRPSPHSNRVSPAGTFLRSLREEVLQIGADPKTKKPGNARLFHVCDT